MDQQAKERNDTYQMLHGVRLVLQRRHQPTGQKQKETRKENNLLRNLNQSLEKRQHTDEKKHTFK